MSKRTIQFHRVEEYTSYANGGSTIILSFDTDRFGIYQIGYSKDSHTEGLEQLKNEPDINMLRQRNKSYVERVARIVFRMVFDAPAMTERFE